MGMPSFFVFAKMEGPEAPQTLTRPQRGGHSVKEAGGVQSLARSAPDLAGACVWVARDLLGTVRGREQWKASNVLRCARHKGRGGSRRDLASLDLGTQRDGLSSRRLQVPSHRHGRGLDVHRDPNPSAATTRERASTCVMYVALDTCVSRAVFGYLDR